MQPLSLKWPRPVVAGLVALGAAAAAPATAAAHPDHRASGYVYVDDNSADTNAVAAFVQSRDGGLTPVPGSPFNAGGAGTGAGLASQGAIQVSSDRHYVLAVDAGSNQISVLRIRRDGGLELVPGGVVSSGGVHPVSVAEHDGLVYVANSGAGGSNYTGFTLSDDGHLRPLAGSTVPLPDSAQPGDVLFNATGSNLIGTRVGTSQIDSFRVGFDGRLRPAAGSPFTAQGPGPFGSEFRPTNPSQLFVSNAHGPAGAGTVSAFGVERDGTLSPIGNSPFADQQTAPCWVEITRDGEFLFTVNTGSGSISRYSIAADGTLRLLGSTPVSSQAGVGAVDARLSVDGRSLYVDESRVDTLGVFDVDGGGLNERGSVALPHGAAPAGVAVR
ncbi:MAG: beta-propeller fold lactonase family protein [Solirubrobacterales bacterium]|nr:beta-propeller fold lactonase family protein [Solirubrobacterales bacterium]